jgi:hypothetical protein
VSSRRERAKKRKLFHDEQEKVVLITDAEIVVGGEEIVDSIEADSPAMDIPDAPCPSFTSSSTQTAPAPRLSAKQFIDDPVGMQTFTGLESYEKFKFVLQSLGPAAYKLNYFYTQVVSLDIEEQFFITLLKLRCADPNKK